MKNLLALFSGIGLIACAYLLNTDSQGLFKRQVYSVELTGENKIRRVETLASPILTPLTIGENVKKKIVTIEAIDLANVDKYIEKVRPMFTSEYFKTQEKDLRVKAEFFIKHLVRVREFVVTKEPVYIGSQVSDTPNWTFYLEGVYGNKGFGIKDKFGTLQIYVTVEEAKSSKGNPIGIEISKITYLN